MMKKDHLLKFFEDTYGYKPHGTHFYFCPGRVNLIGEHIDYNGGLVMPAAIQLGIYVVAVKTKGSTIRLSSNSFPGIEEVSSVGPIKKSDEPTWVNYVLGLARELQGGAYVLPSCDILFISDLPIGSGLSSSAAIEVISNYLFRDLLGLEVNVLQGVDLCKKVENEFIGVKSGIMDPFAVSMGKKDHAILLNCETLEYEYVKATFKDYKWLILDSMHPRTLASSAYNERKMECENALAYLQKKKFKNHLVEYDLDDVQQIQDEKIQRRALHVITEQQRVLKAAEAMKNNDVKTVAELMNDSHDSLKENYEVTGFYLDSLVYRAREHEACIGARMTGAGFGGCIISLVRKDESEEFIQYILEMYKQDTGLQASCYMAELRNGVHKLN